MEWQFDHERLKVYQDAISFIAWFARVDKGTGFTYSIKDQMARAASSIALNLAEGNGKTSMKDRCRFFEIAKGSALECAAVLDVLCVLEAITEEQMKEGKRRLGQIVAMMVGLIRATENRASAAREDEVGYGEDVSPD